MAFIKLEHYGLSYPKTEFVLINIDHIVYIDIPSPESVLTNPGNGYVGVRLKDGRRFSLSETSGKYLLTQLDYV